MQRTAAPSFRARTRPSAGDVAPATVLLGVGLVEATWALGGERQVALALVPLLTVPLAWRRLRPSTVALVVVAALVVQVPWATLRLFDQTFTGFVCVLLASFALGRHGRPAGRVLVLAGCALAAALALAWYDRSVGTFVLGVVFVVGPAATGRLVAVRAGLRELLDRQGQMIRETLEVTARTRVSEVRGQIAGEVQDLVSRRVHDMVVRAELAARVAQSDSAAAAELVATTEADGRAALEEMRSMLAVLRTPELVSTDAAGGAAPVGSLGLSAALPVRRAELLLTAVLVVVCLGEVLASPGAPPVVSLTLTGPLLAFAVGTRTHGRRTSVAALGTVLLAVAVIGLLVFHDGWGDYAFPAVLVLLAWLAGRMVQQQNDLLARARSRAATLERGAQVRAAAAATEERLRLARELHDVLAHTLMVMVVQAGAARRSLETGRVGVAAGPLNVIQQTGHAASDELRRLLTLVSPGRGALVPEPGGSARLDDLQGLVDRARATGLEADLVVEGEPAAVADGPALALYRIAQEALTNVIRHAQSQKVHLRLHYLPGELRLSVRDDGRAVQVPGGARPGNGITGMRERTELYGGELVAGPSPGGGFLVIATIPLTPMPARQLA